MWSGALDGPFEVVPSVAGKEVDLVTPPTAEVVYVSETLKVGRGRVAAVFEELVSA